MRLRRHLAFERLLARLFQTPSPWALKGGYAMELRFQQARTTKDIDLVVEEKQQATSGPVIYLMLCMSIWSRHLRETWEIFSLLR